MSYVELDRRRALLAARRGAGDACCAGGFLRRPLAVAGLVVALAFVARRDLRAAGSRRTRPSATDFDAILAQPSREHLLGTDELGRDILSRIIWGARASIQAGVLATLLAMVIGVPLGLVAGYYRGWIDPVISRSPTCCSRSRS